MPTKRDAPLSHQAIARLAPLVTDILQRHVREPVMAAFAPGLTPLASQLIDDIAAIGARKSEWSVTLAASAKEVAALHRLLKLWTPMLVDRIGHLEPSEWSARADAPWDVLAKAGKLLHLAAAEASDAPFAQAMCPELERQIERTKRAQVAADDAGVALQELQREVRKRIHTFNHKLVLLRRVVQALLGPKHPDYRALLVPRRRVPVQPGREAVQGGENGRRVA